MSISTTEFFLTLSLIESVSKHEKVPENVRIQVFNDLQTQNSGAYAYAKRSGRATKTHRCHIVDQQIPRHLTFITRQAGFNQLLVLRVNEFFMNERKFSFASFSRFLHFYITYRFPFFSKSKVVCLGFYSFCLY